MAATTTATICFHVIFVRDTVGDLLPFLHSLHEHSDCHFRLVSNGCSGDEEQLLQALAAQYPRLSYYRIDTRRMLPHHEVLHQLLPLDEDPWFAFIDSDMLALAPFMPPFRAAMEKHDGIFTGLPLWHEEHEQSIPLAYNVLGGRYYKAHNDMITGLSYCALYRREPLLRFMETSGIGFERYHWHQIPIHIQKQVQGLGLKKRFYDTAKLLNILWQQEGGRFCVLDSKELLHLGGISGTGSKPDAGWNGYLLGRWAGVIKRFIRFLRMTHNLSETLDLLRLVNKRRAMSELMGMLVRGESFDESHPVFRKLSPALRARMLHKAGIISNTYRQFQKKQG